MNAESHWPPADPEGSSIMPALNAAAAGSSAQNPVSPDSGAVGAIGSPGTIVAATTVGGLVGTADHRPIADRLNPSKEHKHWLGVFKKREDVDHDAHNYADHYGPAYQYGWEAFAREYNLHGDNAKMFDRLEHHMGKEWNKHRGENDLTWEQAKSSAHEAYNRAFLIFGDK